MLKEKKTTTQSKIPFLWLQSRLPIHKREFSRIGWTTAAREHDYVIFYKLLKVPNRAIQCGGFWGFRFFWVTSKEVPRVDSRKSPVEVKKSKPSKIYLAL